MSESFQVRKNTTLSPRGKNQIVMVLFLIWLLRWANLFTCRLSLFLQTFQPTLFGAHTVRTGAWLAVALPWDLCQPLRLRVDNASSFCPTRTTPSQHTPFLVPSISWCIGAPRAEVRVPDSHGHHQAAVAAQQTLWNVPTQMVWILRPAWSLGVGGLQDARWLWVVHRSNDPPEPLKMQQLVQVSLRDGVRSWSIAGSGEVWVPSLFP